MLDDDSSNSNSDVSKATELASQGFVGVKFDATTIAGSCIVGLHLDAGVCRLLMLFLSLRRSVG